MLPYERKGVVGEFGRWCVRCKQMIPAGGTVIIKRNGYGRCTRPECGGPEPAENRPPAKPPGSGSLDATMSEDEIRKACRTEEPCASDKRRRGAGHGYSGGDGFTSID